jgi:tetratricopeptide (TPR) repeat protein
MKHNNLVYDYSQLVEIVCKISDSYLYNGRLEDAIQIVDHTLVIAENKDINPKDRVRLLLQSGMLLNRRSFFGDSELEKSVENLTLAQQTAMVIGEQELAAIGYLYLGEAHDYLIMNSGKGDYQDSVNYFEQALALFQANKNHEWEGKAIFNIGLIHQRKKEMAKAKACFIRAYKIAVDGNYQFDQSLAARHLGFIHFISGEYRPAEEYAKESLKLREELGYRLYLPPAHHVLGSLYIALEKWEQALDHLEIASKLAEEMKLNVYLIQIQLALGEWHKRQGNKENAKNLFQLAYDIATELDYSRWQEAAMADLKAL